VEKKKKKKRSFNYIKNSAGLGSKVINFSLSPLAPKMKKKKKKQDPIRDFGELIFFLSFLPFFCFVLPVKH
jgi:hypothetical protein